MKVSPNVSLVFSECSVAVLSRFLWPGIVKTSEEDERNRHVNKDSGKSDGDAIGEAVKGYGEAVCDL